MVSTQHRPDKCQLVSTSSSSSIKDLLRVPPQLLRPPRDVLTPMGPAALIPVMVSRSVSPLPFLPRLWAALPAWPPAPHTTSTHVQSPTRFSNVLGIPPTSTVACPAPDENNAAASLAFIIVTPASAPKPCSQVPYGQHIGTNLLPPTARSLASYRICFSFPCLGALR